MTAAPSLTRPEAVLFDWDNTLVDTWGVIHEALSSTFDAMEHPPWTLEQTRERVHRSLRETFPELFGDRWEEAQQIFYDRYQAIHLIKLEILPGSTELIEALKANGVYLGVVSNKAGKNLRSEASHLGWDGFFSRLVGATDAPRDKPAREPVELALGPDIEPGPNVWFVGDTPIDMECAHATGCVAILVRDDVPTENEFGAFFPHHHFRDCEKLASLVRSL